MQKLRLVHDRTVRDVASAFGCSPSHISRVELGKNPPSRPLVQFYEDAFGADGLLLSLYEVVVTAGEQKRRRRRGRTIQPRALPGDGATFVDAELPHGSVVGRGEFFVQTWHILNSGTVAWTGRQLERQRPVTGPGLITSPYVVWVADTPPGQIAAVGILLKAPGYDCTSIAYFKMIDQEGSLCFPDNYQLGLDVLVMVRGQHPIRPHKRGGGRRA